MEDYRIKDNKRICYNLYNKLFPYKAREQLINAEIRRIMKAEKCNELTATEIYKNRLKAKIKEIEESKK